MDENRGSNNVEGLLLLFPVAAVAVFVAVVVGRKSMAVGGG